MIIFEKCVYRFYWKCHTENKTEIMMFISPAIIEATQCGECKDAKIINEKKKTI
jgi:hypothetical protein